MDHLLAKTILITKVVELIAEAERVSLKVARDHLYNSTIVGLIEDDETGLYGDSPLYVFSLYERESKMINAKLDDLQPSQFYISEKKLKEVESWFNPLDLSNFKPLPIHLLDEEIILTDGHTRAVVALKHGLSKVPLVYDNDELNWEMYRECVKECKKQGITSPGDLLQRIITEEEYHEKWDKWCDEMQAKIKK